MKAKKKKAAKKRTNPADDTRRNRLKTRRDIADLQTRVKALEETRNSPPVMIVHE